jgi:sec-independent protein translocase protein TatB
MMEAGMPSFSDSIFLFVLALLLFGPKKLPVLARELGKWIGEFRRASNEFKMQMEEELRQSEQAERQKQIAAMEAAAPAPPTYEEPEHPHMRDSGYYADVPTELPQPADESGDTTEAQPSAPLPIATSGSLSIMPPSTGLPTPRGRHEHENDALGGLIESIPESHDPAARQAEVQETAAHG